MPALITHNLFAKEALASSVCSDLTTTEEHQLFKLASQGPDPFFFRFRTTPQTIKKDRAIASELHNQRITDSLEWLRSSMYLLDPEDRMLGRAFALGYLAHYTLDRLAHPYIFGLQYELMKLDPSLKDSGSAVHGVIESDIDSFMLKEKCDKNPNDIQLTNLISTSKRALLVAGHMMSTVVYAVLGYEISPKEYGKCVGDMRFLYSKLEPYNSLTSRIIRICTSTARSYSQVHALAHRNHTAEDSVMNSKRNTWSNPFTGDIRAESFIDLYNQALKDFTANARMFLENKPLANLTKHIGFDGQLLNIDEQPLKKPC